MKFRITPRDFLIFVIFAVLLLLLSSILVVNFYSLGNDGVFYGLNPFRGLLLPYLPVTLIVFIVAIIVIFTSVSSYIFDKEKGSGFGLLFGDKKEKGYSRWCDQKEMKNAKGVEKVIPNNNTISSAGIPIINNGKEIWCDNGEYHTLVLGSTGCGKSESIVKPTVKLLAKKGESMIITDPKGELYRESAETLKRMGYNIILLNFREPQNGNAWNPLSLPYSYYKAGNTDKAIELLEDVAMNILIDKKNSADPFWEKQASDYFSGLAMGLFQDAKEAEVNLNSISNMATVGEDKFAGSRFINEYFNMKGDRNTASIFASGTINAPNETKQSIISVFRSKIRIFSTRDSMSEMLGHSDFDMKKIGEEKTAVFMIIHDEKKTYHALSTIFVKQCYECLIDVAQKNGGKLKYRTNFLLDEFANMPPLNDVDAMVSAARSRDIRFTFIIQNFAQLKDTYGENIAEVIKGNCGNIVYLISTEISALEEISKMCGEVKSKEKEKTSSTPLVSVTDLQKMKLGEAIYKRLRMDPFRTQLSPDQDVNWGFEKTISEYPLREVAPVEMFDLKEFVKVEKEKQMKESGINSPDFKANPFGGGLSNPFMSERPNPFSSNRPNSFERDPNPFNRDHNPFNREPGLPANNLDLDAMLKDIDRRIAEMEAEEKKEMEEQNKKVSDNHLEKDSIKNEGFKNINEDFTPINIYNEPDVKTDDHIKGPDVKPETSSQKPIINVDADSVVVNENVITDDEFFDDFFGDDE